MEEKLIILNDYTLIQKIETQPDITLEGYNVLLRSRSQTTRTFNFLAAQLTTTTRDYAYADSSGGGATVATQTFIQNFEDMQSPREIAYMHAALMALGGKPPPLEEVTGGLNKKSGLGSLRNA